MLHVSQIYERDIGNVREHRIGKATQSIPTTMRASRTSIDVVSYRIVSAWIAPENPTNLHNDIISERSRCK